MALVVDKNSPKFWRELKKKSITISGSQTKTPSNFPFFD